MSSSRLQVRITRKTVEAADICSFELEPVNGEPLPSFSAGSHIDVDIDEKLTRQYSLCNDPQERHRYLISVLNSPRSRGGSRGLHERFEVGDTLTISEPKNHFALAHGAQRSVLLAGGIGITPLLCMAERLSAINAAFELHYCGRSLERMAFCERIQSAPYAHQVHLHLSGGDAAKRLNFAQLLRAPQPETHLYVCGPKTFMDAALAAARAAGWPESHLHYEFFEAELIKADTDGMFEVQLASSGRVILVAKDQTVAQALKHAGVEIAVSCEQGVCGTCLTRVLQGTPDHRDVFLSAGEQAANDQFLPCCSRSKSPRLVLDL